MINENLKLSSKNISSIASFLDDSDLFTPSCISMVDGTYQTTWMESNISQWNKKNLPLVNLMPIRCKTEAEVNFLEKQFAKDPKWSRATVQICKRTLTLKTAQIYKWGFDKKRMIKKKGQKCNASKVHSDRNNKPFSVAFEDKDHWNVDYNKIVSNILCENNNSSSVVHDFWTENIFETDIHFQIPIKDSLIGSTDETIPTDLKEDCSEADNNLSSTKIEQSRVWVSTLPFSCSFLFDDDFFVNLF